MQEIRLANQILCQNARLRSTTLQRSCPPSPLSSALTRTSHVIHCRNHQISLDKLTGLFPSWFSKSPVISRAVDGKSTPVKVKNTVQINDTRTVSVTEKSKEILKSIKSADPQIHVNVDEINDTILHLNNLGDEEKTVLETLLRNPLNSQEPVRATQHILVDFIRQSGFEHTVVDVAYDTLTQTTLIAFVHPSAKNELWLFTPGGVSRNPIRLGRERKRILKIKWVKDKEIFLKVITREGAVDYLVDTSIGALTLSSPPLWKYCGLWEWSENEIATDNEDGKQFKQDVLHESKDYGAILSDIGEVFVFCHNEIGFRLMCDGVDRIISVLRCSTGQDIWTFVLVVGNDDSNCIVMSTPNFTKSEEIGGEKFVAACMFQTNNTLIVTGMDGGNKLRVIEYAMHDDRGISQKVTTAIDLNKSRITNCKGICASFEMYHSAVVSLGTRWAILLQIGVIAFLFRRCTNSQKQRAMPSFLF